MRTPAFMRRFERFLPRKPEPQAPMGWWQDAKGRSQPPGSYRDASLRTGDDGRLAALRSKRRPS